MKKTFIMIISVIAMISLAKCGYDEYTYGDMTPKINPYPTKKVRIYGKFPFDKNVTLRFMANYQNGNPKCDTVYRTFGFVDAVVKKKENIDIHIVKNNQDNYEAFFYQDYFLPGVCEWKIYSLENWTHWDRDSGVSFVKIVDSNIDKKNILLECNIKNIQIFYPKEKKEKYLSCFPLKTKDLKEPLNEMPYYEVSKFQNNIEVNFINKRRK